MQHRLNRLLVAAIAVTGFLALPSRASADVFINLELKGYAGGSANVEFKGDTILRPVGPFSWKDTNVDNPNTSFPPTIKTFCIELDQPLPNLTPPTATFRITDPANAPIIKSEAKADAIRALYGNYYDFATDSVKGGLDRAFQIALWEIIYDFGSLEGLDLTNGDFAYLVNSQTLLDAIAMLQGLSGGKEAFDRSGYELVALVAPAGDGKTEDKVQDQIAVRPKGVPAPPALLLAGFGMVALLGRARWTRRSNAA